MFVNIKIKKRTACSVLILVFLFASLFFMNTFSKGSIRVDSQPEGIRVPIIMYHSVLKDKKASNDYVITPKQLESDLKYIRDNGYTPVFVSDLIDYTYNNKQLPQKPIVLSFDDGFYNNYRYAFELLKEYKFKAVFSPLVVETERYSQVDEIPVSYGYCSYKEIKEMNESGYIEIQNHTYDMHSLKPRKGAAKKKGEDVSVYRKNLCADLEKAQKLLKDNADITFTCMVYPYGAYSEESEKIIKELGYKASFSCTEKMNYVTKDKDCLYEMGRYLRKSSYSTKTLFERMGE